MPNFKAIKRIRSSIFNKITFAYSVIVICTISILVSIILLGLSNMLREQAVAYTGQVTKTVTNYFHSQCADFKKVQNGFYIPNDRYLFSDDLIPMLENNGREITSAYIVRYRVVNDFFRSTAMPNDRDTEDIFLLNKSLNWDMRFSRGNAPKEISARYDVIRSYLLRSDHPASPSSGKRVRIVPAFDLEGKRFYAIYDYVRDPDAKNYAGYLVYTYGTDCMKNSYALFDEYLIGTILVITPDGNVIFDSAGEHYRSKFAGYEKMSGHISGSYAEKGCIVNYTRDNTYDFITVGVIPENAIYQKVDILNEKITLVAVLCIASVILLTVLTTGLFAKRIKIIVRTIQKIQKGDFSARAEVGDSGDEVQVIANNLNIMSKRIDEYIKKEYVYKLRQKDAMLKQKTDQLYTLQMQVNPHFLYNTLEVIRMTALGAGDTGAEKMIKLLAKMLRSTVKGGMFLTVREELQNCESYLELVKIRFGDRLRVSYHIDPRILSYTIPKNIMQPIVENSIVHGGKANSISIEGVYEDGKIIITVSDNGVGIPGPALSGINAQLNKPYDIKDNRIGIFNANSRIKLLFGDKYGVRLKSSPGEGTRAVVTFGAKRSEDLLQPSGCGEEK